MDFGWLNAEIGRKMANGRPLFLVLYLTLAITDACMEMLVAELWQKLPMYFSPKLFWENFKDNVFEVEQKTSKLEPLKFSGYVVL